MIDGKNLHFLIVSNFNETQNKWWSCHSKAKYKRNFEKYLMFCSLRVIDGRNVYFSILSDFDETQNKWWSCHFKAKYKQKFQKKLKRLLITGAYGWLTEKISIFQLCPILMKLKTNDVIAILKQNINKSFKFFECFAYYGWLTEKMSNFIFVRFSWNSK